MPRRSPAARTDAPPPPPRAPLLAAFLLSLAGLGVALVLIRLHAQAHAGVASFCAVSETVNCDKVATSPWSVVLRLPVATWGALGYGLAAVLSGWALFGPRPHPRWPVGLLAALAAAAVAASLVLAWVSKFLIGAWCLLCVASWTVSAALLVAAWMATRPGGPLAALATDLATARGAPRPFLGLVAGSAVALAAVMALSPRYWDRPPAAPAPASAAAAALAAPNPPAAAVSGPPVVVSYSDYECPYCARVHAELKEALKARPDVRLVKRHFPLDQGCNPLLRRPMHLEACRMARAAICAEAQGKLDEMDSALYGNQAAKRPVEALATELGLDLGRFGACLDAPETTARLRADVEAGLRDGVKATPTFVLNGVAYSGQFPLQSLPPPPPPLAPPPPAR